MDLAHLGDTRVMSRVVRAFEEIHKLQVLHRDVELRNMMYDDFSG